MLLGVDDTAIRQRESGGRPILFMRPSARRALQPVSYVLNINVRGLLFLERVHFVLIYGDVSLFFLSLFRVLRRGHCFSARIG